MKIKELLKDCTINPPNVFITLWNNKVEINIELCEEDDFSNFISTYGDSEIHDWAINNFSATYVFFFVKKLVTKE